MIEKLEQLGTELEGDFFTDVMHRTLYATDASVYREMPLAVSRPANEQDIKKLISFANKYKTSLIFRTAGTSLAGQVVGKGIVVDVSRTWNKIIELNEKEKWVRVQPGVNLDELNQYLEQYDLFFGPETSTSNRCMIGGMVGNNSCGSHSILYGTTRDHVLELKTILSDGSEAVFKPLSAKEFEEKCEGDSFENKLYRYIRDVLGNKENEEEIRKEFPKPGINRRNTGYAVDVLLDSEPFSGQNTPFNFCKLLAGSEGTLAFTSEIKLNLVDLPPDNKAVVAVHLNSIHEATRATLIARKYNPGAVELLDDFVLQQTKKNLEQQKNRFFVTGDPGALLVVELMDDSREAIKETAAAMEKEMRDSGYGFHFPIIWGQDIKRVWDLRKAGLGLLTNFPGDPKPVACIEDTAVAVEDQPEFIDEFEKLLATHDMNCVFYAHIGDGEIHLRPVLDLKLQKDRDLFYTITDEVATLVKKYRGSLSGEHGDGRVRAPFLKKMIGEKNYNLLIDLKNAWDPNHIFNPNKIVEAPSMTDNLRYEAGQKTNQFDTVYDFTSTDGILRMAEKCNGTAACRKTHHIGGTMCPSYMATRNEKDTTRARANILREFLSNSPKKNKFDHEEIKEVMELCIMCKGCKSECPSNVDVAMMKGEFLQHYYDANGVPFRTRMIGNFAKANAINSTLWPGLANWVQKNKVTGAMLKGVIGIAQKRSIPALSSTTLRKWAKQHLGNMKPHNRKQTVYLFCDEYTNYNEAEIGIKTIKLLTALGYEVKIVSHPESGRTFMSKGLLKDARKVAEKNVRIFKNLITEKTPLLGIEPSAILSFSDEYPRLVNDLLKDDAMRIGENAFMVDEFLTMEAEKGHISIDDFTMKEKKVLLHGHCHQKALSSVSFSEKMLGIPKNYSVETIPSGCCGMAGSFGYEKEHFDVSMNIGELVLFPAVRKAEEETIIAAPGTSCRHQIKDGTGQKALHTIEVLYDALK